jgi:hypothetical protein
MGPFSKIVQALGLMGPQGPSTKTLAMNPWGRNARQPAQACHGCWTRYGPQVHSFDPKL